MLYSQVYICHRKVSIWHKTAIAFMF